MALTRWTPWQGLFDMQRDMDLLTKQLFGSLESPATRKSWVPAVDVFPRGNDLVIRAELPGIDPDKDVEIQLRDNVLTIRGERRHEERENVNGGSRFESVYGSFERSVLLPDGVNENDIRASYENGVLEVVVPGVVELTQPKRIPIAADVGQKELTTQGESQKELATQGEKQS
jgi:HSP20 family protein